MISALNGKPERAIQRRQFVGAEPLRLPLAQANSSYALPILHLIVQWNRVSPEMNAAGQRLQPRPCVSIDELRGLESDSGSQEIVPAVYPLELLPISLPQRLRRDVLQGPAGSAPELVQLCQGTPQTVLIRVACLTLPQCLSQGITGRVLELRRDLIFDIFDFGFQLKAEVGAAPLDHQTLVLSW